MAGLVSLLPAALVSFDHTKAAAMTKRPDGKREENVLAPTL
jgi:hypothetical protein